MPHIDTKQVVEDILADVGSVVGDPLQVADHEEQMDSRRYRRRVSLHGADEAAAVRVPQLVYRVIRQQDAPR